MLSARLSYRNASESKRHVSGRRLDHRTSSSSEGTALESTRNVQIFASIDIQYVILGNESYSLFITKLQLQVTFLITLLVTVTVTKLHF